MNAYSEDLRKKIVEALRRGMGKSEAARSFGVSLSSVKRYASMAEEGKPLAPKKRPGSRPKMDEGARRLLESDMGFVAAKWALEAGAPPTGSVESGAVPSNARLVPPGTAIRSEGARGVGPQR